MLIFAKDISERDHKHAREPDDPELKRYMEYQRTLFPYTIVRAGLDLAYKELDDILNYVDNGHQPPADSQRDTYPSDVPEWYRRRYPWTASFMDMETAHAILVLLIQAMDSFRTHEALNTYHWVVLYDAVLNIVKVYNDLLATNPNNARDIHLSQNTEVNFDDFINNYWPHLEFMILSQPDYPHARLLPRNEEIEAFIKERFADGVPPMDALQQADGKFQFQPGTLSLLRRDPVDPARLRLTTRPLEEPVHAALYETLPEDSPYAGLTRIDAEYAMNFQHARRSASAGSTLKR